MQDRIIIKGARENNLKKIDLSRRAMVMLDGTEIPLDDVVDIQCELFACLACDKPGES